MCQDSGRDSISEQAALAVFTILLPNGVRAFLSKNYGIVYRWSMMPPKIPTRYLLEMQGFLQEKGDLNSTAFFLQVQRFDLYQGYDLSLATFLAGLSPDLQKKCSLQTCGDMPAAHMVTYLHSKGLVSFSVTHLPEEEELPGAADGSIWFWARPTEV